MPRVVVDQNAKKEQGACLPPTPWSRITVPDRAGTPLMVRMVDNYSEYKWARNITCESALNIEY